MSRAMRHGVAPNDAAASVALWGAVAAFAAGWLAGRVADRGALAIERQLERVSERLPSWVKAPAYASSGLAYPIVYLPASLWIASAVRRRGSHAADVVPRAALLAWVTHHVAKSLVHRERPRSEQGSAGDDRSYPSGHATAAVAIALAAALASRDSSEDGTSVVRLAAAAPVLIGASRVALGKHWPTDVIGGWATGVAVASYAVAKRGADHEHRGGADAP